MSHPDALRDPAALRHWLRALASGRSRRAPNPAAPPDFDLAALRRTVRRQLNQLVTEGELRAEHAHAWSAAAGLSGAPVGQPTLAAQHGVTDRTIRSWLARTDNILTSALQHQATERPKPSTPPSPTDAELDLVVAIAALLKSLALTDAPPEHQEAVRHYAAEHLHAPPPAPRSGSKRWLRQRFLPTVPARAEAAFNTVLTDERIAANETPTLLAMPYQLHDDPAAAIRELSRAWSSRDRIFIPLLANHALHTARAHPQLPVDDRLHMLEVISNALRDAENLQAFIVATQWKALARNTFGPHDPRVWKADGLLIHMMQIYGYHDAARRAQERHIANFPHARFTDPADAALHDLDRFARQITLEITEPTAGSRGRAADLVRRLRNAHDRYQSPSPEDTFTVLRRRLEVALHDAVVHSRGQRLGQQPFDALVMELEQETLALPPHRALARYELLLKVDAARRDWRRTRERVPQITAAVNHPGAPANLAERIDHRLREMSARGFLDEAPKLAIPPDPLRSPTFTPLHTSRRHRDL